MSARKISWMIASDEQNAVTARRQSQAGFEFSIP
jgi:hypothetical protein